MVEIISTREWEKNQIKEFIENYIAQFAQDAQINLEAPSAQHMLSLGLVSALEEKGYLK